MGRSGREGKRDFDARMCLVEIFVEMSFDDPIVVESQAFTERVLGDLEAAIHVASQGRGEEESDGEGEWS